MIADALRMQIHEYAARMPRTNPLYFLAAEGVLAPAQVVRYLENVHYLIQHTPAHLARARDAARRASDPALARHFEHKLAEEHGHDAWSARDIERLRELSRGAAPSGVVPGMRAFVEHIERIIEEDPRLYLAYILFAEYLIVLLGPAWLALLETRCGIPGSAMTVIGNHAELDRQHSEEAFEQIDELVSDPARLPRLREVLAATITLFDRFCVEVTGTPTRDELSHVHVTAA